MATTIKKEIQDGLLESGDDYVLLTDQQIIDYICENGNGFYDFHAADINRIIVENVRMKEKLGITEI